MAEDIAYLGFDIDSAPALGAAKNLLQLDDAAAKADRAAARLETTFRKSNGQFQRAADYARDNAAEIRSLAAQYNAALAAELKFADVQKEVARAVQLGVVAADQQDAVLERLQAQYIATANAATRTGTAFGGMQASAGNVFAQLNDIGVMMASGQNPFVLALQQGTQLNQVWASMGKEGRTVRGVFGMLGAGLMQFANPMGIATIATIAGASALVQWGVSAIGAKDDAKDLKDVIDDLSGAISDYQSIVRGGADYTKYIVDEFGALNANTVELAERVQKLKLTEVLISANDAATSLANTFSGGLRSEMARLVEFSNDLGYYYEQADQAAWEFAANLDLLRTANGPREQLDAVRVLSEQMLIAADSTEKMTEEQFKFYSNLVLAEQKLSLAVSLTSDNKDETNNWAGAMSGVRVEIESIMATLSRIGGGAISNAAKQSEIDALKAGKSIKDAAQQAVIFQKTLEFDAKRQGANWFERQAIDAEEFQFRHGLALDAVLDKERELAREREKAASKSGGGGAKKVSALESLIGKFDTDPYAEVNLWYSKVNQALMDAQLIERGMLEQHNAYKLEIEQNYQQQLAAIRAQEQSQTLNNYGTLFGNMATLFEAGGKKTFALAKAFSVAQGLMNSYRAYTEVLADPSLIGRPFLRQALAASTLAAGLAQVASMRSTNFGSSGGSSAPTGASSGTATATPERIVRVDFNGPAWARDLVEGLATQLFEASEDGTRVIFAR